MSQRFFENEEFYDLKLKGSYFDRYEFVDCKFINCTVEECELSACLFTDCTFEGCTITSLRAVGQSQMQFSCFYNCCLMGVNWPSLQPKGMLSSPIKQLNNCTLKYNTFFDMDFKGFVFSGNEIYGSLFSKCRLEEGKLACGLSKTEFFDCNLKKADFTQAQGYQIDVASCDLKNALFALPEAVNLLYGLGIKLV